MTEPMVPAPNGIIAQAEGATRKEALEALLRLVGLQEALEPPVNDTEIAQN